jgi:hypothetical protein
MDIQKNRERDEIFMEVPSTPHYPDPERIPSPSDPMGKIYTEGLVLRSLGSGNVKWWVLISGWVFYGLVFLVFVSIALSSMSYLSILSIVVASIPLISIGRGIAKKLSKRHHKSIEQIV